MSETPLIGRNARLYKNGVVIAYGKSINVRAITAPGWKEYSMDSLEPALQGPGAVGYAFTIERLYTNGEFMDLFITGTTFDMVFQPTGAYKTAPYETWNDCIITNVSRKAGLEGGIIETIEGQTTTVTVTDA
jgi:hypothetical protein